MRGALLTTRSGQPYTRSQGIRYAGLVDKQKHDITFLRMDRGARDEVGFPWPCSGRTEGASLLSWATTDAVLRCSDRPLCEHVRDVGQGRSCLSSSPSCVLPMPRACVCCCLLPARHAVRSCRSSAAIVCGWPLWRQQLLCLFMQRPHMGRAWAGTVRCYDRYWEWSSQFLSLW